MRSFRNTTTRYARPTLPPRWRCVENCWGPRFRVSLSRKQRFFTWPRRRGRRCSSGSSCSFRRRRCCCLPPRRPFLFDKRNKLRGGQDKNPEKNVAVKTYHVKWKD